MFMRELLIATRNKGKFPEMIAGLQGTPFTFLSANDVPTLAGFEPDETSDTFEGNALLKAREYGEKAGMLTIADDSGVEIDALGGAPGVRSARYVEGSDADRYRAVLDKMKDVPDDQRGARFVSIIAIYDPLTKKEIAVRGECMGEILRAPRGEHGFGYDPIFFVPEISKTFAAASIEEKASIDHRGRALRQAKELLKDFV